MSQTVRKSRRIPLSAWAGAFVTAAAAIIIGCGGGGGDSSSTGLTGLTSTSSATSATSSASTATSSATASTSSASTSTSTASTSGTLQPNVIYYSDAPDQTNNTTVTNYNYVSPAGTGNTTFASLSTNFGGVAINSVNQTKYFAYTADPNNPSFGIYSNSTYSITGAKTIVAPSTANPYVFAGEIQVSPDGTTLYYLAAIGSNEAQIFSVPVGGGVAPTALDYCLDTFNLNAQGNQLVYGKVISGAVQIFTRGIAATSTPTQITSNTLFDSDEPQWNKAGTSIAFSADPPNASGPDFLFTMNPDGSGVKQITNTSSQDDHTPSFNGAGTALSFISYTAGAAALTGVYTVNIAASGTDVGRTEIQSDQTVLTGTYWSTTTGRGKASYSFLQRWKKSRKNFFATKG